MSSCRRVPDELCRTCRRIDFSLREGCSKYYLLDPLPKLFERTNCPLCRLATQSFRRLWDKAGLGSLPRYSVHKDIQLGETFFTTSCGPESDRPGFLTFLPMNEDERSSYRTSPTWNSSHLTIVTDLENPDGDSTKSTAQGQVGEYLDTCALRHWLHQCQTYHIQAPWRQSERSPVQLIVVDVLERCLAHLPHGARYFALSYVWGPRISRSPKKVMSCLAGTHLSKCDVPEVIQSGIQLVQDLGERYLWADALCVPQDDSAIKADLISRMDAIYSDAYATIVASGGEHADCGLPGVRGHPRILQDKPEDLGGIKVVLTTADLKDKLATSVWGKRAWTFQERLLSTRCIHFHADDVYFECHHQPYTRKESQIQKRLEGLNSLYVGLHDLDGEIENPLDYLADLLEEYTKRRLSYPEDILNAFAGVLTKYSHAVDVACSNGLPLFGRENLALSLLWEPVTVIKRRIIGNPSGQVSCPFPSWSWCGWEGPVVLPPEIRETDVSAYHKEFKDLEIIPGQQARVDEPAPSLSTDDTLTADELRLTAHSAKFCISTFEAVLLYPRWHRGHKVCMKIFDGQGCHCGLALGFDPRHPLPLASQTYECVRLFSGGNTHRTWELGLRRTFTNPSVDYPEALEAERRPTVPGNTECDWENYKSDDARSDTIAGAEEGQDPEANENVSEQEDEDDQHFFDTKFFARSPDCLLSVLIIERHGDVAERVATGIIHVDAFREAGPVEKTFHIV